MTTIGRTTWCSANLPMATGSASRTLVSRTYVRRPGGADAEREPAGSRAWLPLSVRVLVGGCWRRAGVLATRSPLGAGGGAAFGHRRVGGTGTGQRRAGRRPFARLACVPGREARGCRGPSRRAATHRPSPLTVPSVTRFPEVPQPGVNTPDTRPSDPLRAGPRGGAGLARTGRYGSSLDLPRSGAEPALPGRVGAQRAEEVDAAERRPVGIAEVELRVRALPEQEPAEPLLPRGTDHQVRIGLAGRVEVLGDVLDVQDLGQLFDRGAPGRVVLQHGPHRVGDLAPPAVPDRHVDQQAGPGRRRLARVLQH